MVRSYVHMDKSDWGDGPWQDEPDKLQWIDPATGLDCLIVRNRIGALCGYVGVPSDHPLYGNSEPDLDVHGGVTFTDRCHEDGPIESSICHVPAPGRSDDVWWIGFDCAHAGDYMPHMATIDMSFRFEPPQYVYRDIDYVRAECAALARQLHERRD